MNFPSQSGEVISRNTKFRSAFSDDAVGDNAGRSKRRECSTVSSTYNKQGHQECRHFYFRSNSHGNRSHQSAAGNVARADGGNKGSQHINDQRNKCGVTFAGTYGISGQLFHGAVGLRHTKKESYAYQNHEQAQRESVHNFCSGNVRENTADNNTECDTEETYVEIFINAGNTYQNN